MVFGGTNRYRSAEGQRPAQPGTKRRDPRRGSAWPIGEQYVALMLRPRLIVVTGPTGSGKTTLASKLATQLHLPLVCRDLLKSGMTTHDGRAAFDAFYAILGAHLDR